MSNQQTKDEEEEEEVFLAVYDLSNGMAKSLSAQFLGPNHTLEIIPHTGIILYGTEYYFGSFGIQSAPPAEFQSSMNIYPIDIISLGKTRVTKSDFESWCQDQQNGSWNGREYDLLRHNCNNFSQVAARDGLGLGNRCVPSYILDMPRVFESSPMGMFLRPILEEMQVTGRGRNAGAGGVGDPIGNVIGARNFSSSSSTATAANMDTGTNVNPWANVSTGSSSSSSSDSKNKTPIIDSYNRPFLSTDSTTISTCIQKLNQCLSKLKPLSLEADSSMLTQLGETLHKNDIHIQPSDLEKPILFLVHTFLHPHQHDHDEQRQLKRMALPYALMLSRLLVLHAHPHYGGTTLLSAISDRLLEHSPFSSSTSTTDYMIRSMSWCVLGNASGRSSSLPDLFDPSTKQQDKDSSSLLERLVECALTDLLLDNNTKHQKDQQPVLEVHRTSAAFLYNITLRLVQPNNQNHESDELPDMVVTILCNTLDGLSSSWEKNETCTYLRRLLISSKLIQFYGNTASRLVKDLGLDITIREISQQQQLLFHHADAKMTEGNDEDSRKVTLVARELMTMLSS